MAVVDRKVMLANRDAIGWKTGSCRERVAVELVGGEGSLMSPLAVVLCSDMSVRTFLTRDMRNG